MSDFVAMVGCVGMTFIKNRGDQISFACGPFFNRLISLQVAKKYLTSFSNVRQKTPQFYGEFFHNYVKKLGFPSFKFDLVV
jgi:hypothetical protein